MTISTATPGAEERKTERKSWKKAQQTDRTLKDARNDGIPLQVFRKGGRGLDQLAAELHGDGAGLVPTPPDKDPSEHLLDQIRERAHTTAADLSAQYEAAFHEHSRLQQEAAEYEDAESVEAEIARLGEAALGAEDGPGLVDEDGGGARDGGAEEAGQVTPPEPAGPKKRTSQKRPAKKRKKK